MEIADKVLKKYGCTVELTHNGVTKKTRAVIQPISYYRNSYYSVRRLPIGDAEGGRYLMLASPSLVLPLSGRTIVKDGDSEYLVKNHGCHRAADRNVYVWAVLTACTASSEDDYE